MLRWQFWPRRRRAAPAAADQSSYANWILQRLRERGAEATAAREPGLFALLTLLDKHRPAFFDELAWSVSAQDFGDFEWIILARGASPELRDRLELIRGDARVRVIHAEPGDVVLGWRQALEQARGRYVLPVQAEDRLYPDALGVVAGWLQEHNYPPIAYSDEDQLPPEGVPTHPFCKPDWDPLLVYSGGYAAHLAVLDRRLAMQMGAFTDEAAGGCAVWDACCRFIARGHEPAHIPEILYSRRVATPCCGLRAAAEDVEAAYYVVRQHLRRQRLAEKLNVRANPLPGWTGLWRLAWQRTRRDEPIPIVRLTESVDELQANLQSLTAHPFLALQTPQAQVLTADWADEARALLAALPDAVCVSGCVLDGGDHVLSAGEYFGLDGLVASPYQGRAYGAALGHGRALCQQTVGAPSRDFFIVEADFLRDLLKERANELALSLVHAWVGAEARARGFRVAYSPHLIARRLGAETVRPSVEGTWRFLRVHWQALLDDPSWSRFLNLDSTQEIGVATPARRAAVLQRALAHLAGPAPVAEQLAELATRYPPRPRVDAQKRRSIRPAA
jgi:hypothetical protein